MNETVTTAPAPLAAEAAPQADGITLMVDGANPSWTILCVDDEPNIISALRRLLRVDPSYKILGANGGGEAIALLEAEPVDLIISDMRMPVMDGNKFLTICRERWPEIERLLLTGEADIQTTMTAINRLEVYRYITKPWNDEELLMTVRQTFERRQLQRERQSLMRLTQQQNQALATLNAELEDKVAARTSDLRHANEKLNHNYLNSIKAFSNLIELRSPSLVGHARRVGDVARRIAATLELPEAQQRECFVAGLLHDIGQIGLSDVQLARPMPKLTADELNQYRRHSTLGEQALLALDDMHAVSILIRAHHERWDGQGYPDRLAGDSIPLGACILAVADAYDDLQTGHLGGVQLSKEEARTIINHSRAIQYRPDVVDALIKLFAKPAPPPPPPPRALTTAELEPGMVLDKELVSAEGVMLLAAGHVLTAELISRIKSYERRDELSLILMIKT